jgi:hypothetical protein
LSLEYFAQVSVVTIFSWAKVQKNSNFGIEEGIHSFDQQASGERLGTSREESIGNPPLLNNFQTHSPNNSNPPLERLTL